MTPSTRISLLFQWFDMYYSTKWTNSLPRGKVANVKLVWDNCLKNVTDEDMKAGHELLKFDTKKYVLFPPTPGEFRELCEMAKRRRLTFEYPTVETKKAGRDTARKHINDCWKLLGRPDKIKK